MKYSNETRKVLLAETAERLWADPGAVVREAESRCKSALEEVCRTAAAEDTNVILLSGPSASGKTTSAHRIAGGLEHMGKKARIISLDNFYKPHDRLPLWPNGTLNFESVDGLDTECLGDCLNQLWQKGCADFPIFDFETQNRSAQTMKICWDPQTFLIFEGIHALNPVIGGELGGRRPLRVYVSVHSDFLDAEGETVLAARDLRLTRRMLRDYAHRNSPIQHTLQLWGDVLRGEELYMRPYRGNADLHINTAHDYEPFLYTARLTSLLREAGDCGDYRYLVNRLLAMQKHFFEIGWELVPERSLVREFL